MRTIDTHLVSLLYNDCSVGSVSGGHSRQNHIPNAQRPNDLQMSSCADHVTGGPGPSGDEGGWASSRYNALINRLPYNIIDICLRALVCMLLRLGSSSLEKAVFK